MYRRILRARGKFPGERLSLARLLRRICLGIRSIKLTQPQRASSNPKPLLNINRTPKNVHYGRQQRTAAPNVFVDSSWKPSWTSSSHPPTWLRKSRSALIRQTHVKLTNTRAGISRTASSQHAHAGVARSSTAPEIDVEQ